MIPFWEIVVYASIVLLFGVAVAYTAYMQLRVNVYLHPLDDDIVYPSNIEDVCNVVRKARLLKKKVRVKGSGHSFPDQIRSNDSLSDYLISLDELNHVSIEKRGSFVFFFY